MSTNKSFLGTGWSFPPTFHLELKGVQMVSDEEDIKQSIEIFLGTKLGERVMRPEYGNPLYNHVFEITSQNNPSKYIISKAFFTLTKVLINGIDTPEKGSRAKCKKENELAMQATKFTTDLVGNKELLLTPIKWDKYGGRLIANVKVGGVDIAQELLKKGLARVYSGDKKKSWCD
jgi:endonuclease YncB( thermonuclease family)